AGAVNALLDLLYEERGQAIDGAGGHIRNPWRKKSLARGRHDVKPGFARNLFQKADVAPDVIAGQIGDSADARGFYDFKFLDRLRGEFRHAAPFLRPSL